MAGVLTERKPFLLLLVLLTCNLGLMSSRVRGAGRGSLLEEAILSVAAPFLKAATWIAQGTAGVWRSYVDLRGVERENRRLRAENEALAPRAGEAEEIRLEVDRLRQLLDLRGQVEFPSVAAHVIARGGSVRLVSVNAGIVTLEASGSPGAIVPAFARIEALLRASVPEVAEVRVVWPEAEPTRPAESGELAERVRRVLDDEVNPAIAAHRGRVTLIDVTAGRVRIRLEGGCQGCALAEVTVRQGIESILRKRLPEVVAVVDDTDHEAGTEPFFAPGKR